MYLNMVQFDPTWDLRISDVFGNEGLEEYVLGKSYLLRAEREPNYSHLVSKIVKILKRGSPLRSP